MRTSISKDETKGGGSRLQFVTIEEVTMESMVGIHDAEGVRVKLGDEINMIEPEDHRSRRFGRVTAISEHLIAVRWIRWDEGPAEIDAETFEHWCRIYIDERKAEPEPLTFNVGDGATAIGWSDRYAGTIIEAGPKRVVWQEDKATLLNRDELTVTPGGFAAHWEGVQRYGYERDPNGRTCVYSLRKNGRWIEKGAPLRSTARIVPGRNKHHDYNF